MRLFLNCTAADDLAWVVRLPAPCNQGPTVSLAKEISFDGLRGSSCICPCPTLHRQQSYGAAVANPTMPERERREDFRYRNRQISKKGLVFPMHIGFSQWALETTMGPQLRGSCPGSGTEERVSNSTMCIGVIFVPRILNSRAKINS